MSSGFLGGPVPPARHVGILCGFLICLFSAVSSVQPVSVCKPFGLALLYTQQGVSIVMALVSVKWYVKGGCQIMRGQVGMLSHTVGCLGRELCTLAVSSPEESESREDGRRCSVQCESPYADLSLHT